jgi:hypothetical protein
MDSNSAHTMTSQLLPEETDARTKAMTTTSRPYRAGVLVSNHHSHCTAMAGTVPALYNKPWRKEQADDDHTQTC